MVQFTASAQKLTGQVSDQTSKQPIEGATVQVKRTQAGTLTDATGSFVLNGLQSTDMLTISAVGYKTQEVQYKGQTSLTVELAEGLSLNEVVVTALGLQRNARSLGYSIQKVDGRQVSDIKAPNFLDNLSGKVAGVTITGGSAGKGKDIGVSFNSTFYTERPFQLPRFQNTYGQGNSGAFKYVDGLGEGVIDNISYSYGPKLDAGTLIPQYDSPVNLPDGRVVRGADTP